MICHFSENRPMSQMSFFYDILKTNEAQMRGPSRSKYLVMKRKFVAYFLRHEFSWTFESIGIYLNRDKGTTRQYILALDEMIKQDSGTLSDYAEFKDLVMERANPRTINPLFREIA